MYALWLRRLRPSCHRESDLELENQIPAKLSLVPGCGALQIPFLLPTESRVILHMRKIPQGSQPLSPLKLHLPKTPLALIRCQYGGEPYWPGMPAFAHDALSSQPSYIAGRADYGVFDIEPEVAPSCPVRINKSGNGIITFDPFGRVSSE